MRRDLSTRNHGLSTPATLAPDPPVNASVGSKPSQGFPVMPELCAVGYHLGAVRSETPPVRPQSLPVLKDCRPQRLRFPPVFNLIGAAPGAGLALFRRVLRAQGCSRRPAHQRRRRGSGQDPLSYTLDHVLLLVSETLGPRQRRSAGTPRFLETACQAVSTARRRAGMTRAR